MRQTRLRRSRRRPAERTAEVLRLDPRDPDILRAGRLARSMRRAPASTSGRAADPTARPAA